MKPILNIAAYLFVSLEDLPTLRTKMLEECNVRELKGTILLTGEGINLFLAGKENQMRGFLDWLRSDSRFETLETKESWSEEQPFKKMLIKLKAEIIRMNHPSIRPEEGRANFIKPKKLQEWLDRGTDDLGRPVVMLDTRNAFEVEYGTFENALHFNIQKFTEFPEAIAAHKEQLADKTIVSVCTGGIRCEKSGLYMREIGMEHSYQLEGGILKYFEEVGSAHYQGSCFVFDEREAQKVAERVVTVGGQPRLMVSDADFRYALTLRHVDWMECDGNKLHSAVLGDDVLGKLSSHDLGLIEKRVFLLTLAAEVRYGNMTQEQFDAVMRGQEVKPTQAPQPVGPTTGMGANAAEPESGPTLLATYAGAGAPGAAQSDAA